MLKTFSIYIQYVLPQRLLSLFMGWLAEIRLTRTKNYFIRRYIKKYSIDLTEALDADPNSYPTFNDFFIRRLKPSVRPIIKGPLTIASPADGTVAQLGQIKQQQLTQAKQLYFNLETLFGNDKSAAELFNNGQFATFYLAPNNYHRVHMPISGYLSKTIYVPGRLFSVNRMTSELIPNLYGRNERLVALFETDAGPMAVILVGAMIVGHIQTIWTEHPLRTPHIHTSHYQNEVYLEKGKELGYFKLGSTVVLLFPQHTTQWSAHLQAGSAIQMGQQIGNILK